MCSRREETRAIGRQATKFCMVVPNIFGSSAWNLLHVTVLVAGMLTWLLQF
jgi:hypothetical protein